MNEEFTPPLDRLKYLGIKTAHKATLFRYYRYQLFVDGRVQGDFIQEIKSKEDLYKKRNHIFRDVLQCFDDKYTKNWKYRFIEVRHNTDSKQFLFILVAHRKKKITRDFEEKLITNEPYIWFAIDTDDNCQTIAVEEGKEILPSTAIERISSLLHASLSKAGLRMTVEPIKNEKSFWDYVRDNKEEIREVSFTISPPNMPAISNAIEKSMTALLASANAGRGEVSLRAEKGQALDLNPNNSTLQGLVQHTALGGGSYFFKKRGEQKKIGPQKAECVETALPMEEKSLISEKDSPTPSILTRLLNLRNKS